MIGTIAATLTTLGFLPQVFQVIKTKNTQGISLGMYLMTTTGIFLWAVYGFMNKDMPLLAANTISFISASIILYHKLRYNKSY
ncbi:SemiSWEET transporter [Clostridium butyricum]|uniref:MtN3 and saliva related transmembrane protein n=1 Tax=Clostridium butyricum TaxID=1492 RepID=A0A2S7FEH0_CLOBU|nr:SemiSWEET transporter [Clostridium butyricum]KHD15376.1 membrane protein [Clostridium butyricum]MDB2151678.1 SemiSWEET transporter [Clostridium butyricum]PPV17321.1 hypothetical protein AWN73_08355 [Clostridium butyricum]